jgi:hypothetical protein
MHIVFLAVFRRVVGMRAVHVVARDLNNVSSVGSEKAMVKVFAG